MQGSMALRGMVMGKAIAIPNADPREHDDAEKREQRKPGNLSAIDDDRGGQERPERAAGVAADLEDGLGEAEAAARTQVGDARSFRVKNGGADPDEGDADK